MLTQTKQLLQSTGLLDKLSASELLTEKLGEKLEKYIITALANSIPDDKAAELEEKINDDDPKLAEYLKSNVPDYESILQTAVDNFVADAEKTL
ncbi:hypothetical protein KJ903_00650 [Patescibacteria group bacterium]|nr:hypothetical protein [Patescibacteria group bacterium]